ncbi:MAG: bifunctional hydroxymethylpyrimidine kinase/phosphomethylpyrimidine kinase [Gemmatimonadales bacterium]|nr:bifunctional hydroxymethylpyrimidine kinase/phosphomethylpyrimidine kinase [Gemmatimonadales bacterium]MDZ4391211.1 bifunctional hydroxymethylpyrimidine kinase/phosphomethylpyrimidine kinase [Gemmatimonadales bacterium]
MNSDKSHIALTIAGSDSGGGAGIQADLKTFAAWGCFGTSAIVAITAQNTLGVSAVHPVPLDVVRAQLASLADDLPPHAVKTGMLATLELVELVASILESRGWQHYVLDPVMVATSGDRLLDPDAIAAVRERLVPLAACVTPNLDEAELLVGFPVRDPQAMQRAGEALLALGAAAALIKGGHLEGNQLVDLLVTPAGTTSFLHKRLDTRATHGTGCTLSAAITAGLALGATLDATVPRALEYLQAAMRAAPGLGGGHGPVWHGVVGHGVKAG